MDISGRWFPRVLFATLALLAASPVVASFEDELTRIDELHEEDRHAEIFEMIEDLRGQAADDSERAQLLWRESRAVMNETDLLHRSGDLSDREARRRLETGEELA
ncbi:MAG: hypothetical protein ACLFM0_10540, partial [Spirochaetales bacterium]